MVRTNENTITIEISLWQRISNKKKYSLMEGIKSILQNHIETAEVNKTVAAYNYIAREMDLRNIVKISGVGREEQERIKSAVFAHELQSPRLSMIRFMERVSKEPEEVKGSCMDMLLTIIEESLSNRFMLYECMHNLEAQYKNKQKYNYISILKEVWDFHRKTKTILRVLAQMECYLEKAIHREGTFSGRMLSVQDIIQRFEHVSLYVEVIQIDADVKQIDALDKERLVEHLQLVKSILRHFVFLSYRSYYIYGYGPNDLLFLFYELSRAYSEGSIPDKDIRKLNEKIYLHVVGFNSSIKMIHSDLSLSSAMKFQKITNIRVLSCSFINPKQSWFIYKCFPLVQKALCSILYRFSFLYLFNHVCPFTTQLLCFNPQYAGSLFLTASFICLFIFFLTYQLLLENQEFTLDMLDAIKLNSILRKILILCLIVGALVLFLSIFEDIEISSSSFNVQIFLFLSALWTILDPLIRYEPFFVFRGKRLFITIIFLFSTFYFSFLLFFFGKNRDIPEY
ncbi:hypothetical protein NEFER03_1502 [Nematocida sp. LUAm3]|nr:hypothetical protein NEFER03_1502 [Nematocida sp. LUAm3]KAI5174535.1 hypothetical protein NEFER02_0656 [Nematocida sp. LUAm2]KAI5178059.1 hypothetical protein NEFER01_1241 [Nematocida sp. LUAm1]